MIESARCILASGQSWTDIINYEIVRGNTLWRFALVLTGIVVTMVAGRIAQSVLPRTIS